MNARIIVAVAIVASLVSSDAVAWEADSTHAGLTEQSALSSGLHDSLVRHHGFNLGLFATLQVAPANAEGLFAKLRSLSPNEGFVPNARGKQTALSWLAAGSVLEGMPAKRNQHHFYDPVNNVGLSNSNAGVRGLPFLPTKKPTLDSERFAAFDWVMSDKNDLGMVRFLKELDGSATAADAAARNRHMAYALVCAGAMLHVLQDMGVPSRVRDDLAAHLQALSGGFQDRGSRFEHLAALAFGRLGISKANKPVHRKTARDFFTAKDKLGLADITSRNFYSLGSLPTALDVKTNKGNLKQRLLLQQRLPAPVPVSQTSSVDLLIAASPDGGIIRNQHNVCLANYRVIDDELVWSIGDACALDQARSLLPTVSNYSSGFLSWLFRGKLNVKPDGTVVNGHAPLGKGSLQFYWDNKKGQRTSLGPATSITGVKKRGNVGKQPTVPAGATRVIAVFTGLDKTGARIVSVGQRPLK